MADFEARSNPVPLRRDDIEEAIDLEFWEGTPEGRVVSIGLYCIGRHMGLPSLPDPVLPGVNREGYDRVVAILDERVRQQKPISLEEARELDRLLTQGVGA